MAIGIGLVALFRPSLDWHVEVTDCYVIVDTLHKRKYRYDRMRYARFYPGPLPGLGRELESLAVWWGRLWGTPWPVLPLPGEEDKGAIEIKFKRIFPMFMIFPPFVLPRTPILVRVEEAPRLLAEIRSRMQAGSASP